MKVLYKGSIVPCGNGKKELVFCEKLGIMGYT
jgi:hypothetical protein